MKVEDMQAGIFCSFGSCQLLPIQWWDSSNTDIDGQTHGTTFILAVLSQHKYCVITEEHKLLTYVTIKFS